MNTFNIPSSNLSTLKKSLDKVNRKAAKLGFSPLTVTYGQAFTMKIPSINSDEKILVEFIPVSVAGDMPLIDGWKVLAHIDHIDGINIVKLLPGASKVPADYRTREPYCDHCQSRRIKKYSYIIENTTTQQTMQVGKTCMKDFFGKDITSFMSWFSWSEKFFDELFDEDSEFYKTDRNAFRYPITEAVAVAFASTEEYGYHNSQSNYPTKYDIDTYFFGDSGRAITLEPKHHEQAAAAIKWASEQDASTNDFIAAVQSLIQLDSVPARFFGYAAGIVPFYQNSQRQQKEAVDVLNQHFGEIKDRLDMTLTLKTERTFEGSYGITHIYTFLDAHNRTVVWFASRNMGFEVDETIVAAATIKNHSEYKGVKQTNVTRLKVKK